MRELISLDTDEVREALAEKNYKQQRVLRIKALKAGMFWVLHSRLDRVRIKVDWIDTGEIEPEERVIYIILCFNLLLRTMLQPYRDLDTRGDAEFRKTPVISFRSVQA